VFITFTFHFFLFRSLVLFTRINSLLNLFLVLVLVVDEYPETNVPLTNILIFTKELNELNSTSFLPHFSSNFTREPNILRSIEYGYVIKGLFNKTLN